MKRIALLAALAVVLGLGVGGIMVSSASAAIGSGSVHGHSAEPLTGNGRPDVVTSGSTWTFYDFSSAPTTVGCELLTFGTKTFDGDHGDQGTYKSGRTTTTVKFENGAKVRPGTFKGSYADGQDAYEGIVTETSSGLGYGPSELANGNNPRDVSGC
jgi:hypothetical protein